MVAPSPALTIDLPRARAHWALRQGLSAVLKAPLDTLLAATGWPRTLGGADVYLAVRARARWTSRSALDAAVTESAVQVVPAVRGCIHLVPRVHVPLALRIAEEQARRRMERELEKADVAWSEIEALGAAVVATLRRGARTTDTLRKELPDGAVRSLGERGRKLGLSSTLPPTLRHLEFLGRVERTLEGGRLDTERYVWRVPARDPFSDHDVPNDAPERNARLADIFLRQSGPSSVGDLAAWAGWSKRDAFDALSRTGAAPVRVEGYADDAFIVQDDVTALRGRPLISERVALLPFEDNFVVQRGGPARLVDPRHHGKKIPVWGGTKGTTIGDATHMSMRTVVVGDAIAGLWEFESDTGQIVVHTFDVVPPKVQKDIDSTAAETAVFLRDEIGHARSFALDTDETVRERARLLRKMSAKKPTA